MSQAPRKSNRARVAAVLAAPVIALTLMAPCASAAPAPAKCDGTIHVSLLGHQTCVSSKGDSDSSNGGLSGLLGVVTGLVGGLLGGLLGGGK
ncbi:hypothetical protein GCM10022403_097170 [Streptomyces coacervatus]|uniref:Chaplin n=1 Tax=Streptomyces coacervatus TaxID=647381 RepID=A0ABP7JPN0_9ACTN|nr:hypothetical protein [Streptomyces coacervatus]MDF2264030.1 hypothetical protein [Streptomyces coacervatus]